MIGEDDLEDGALRMLEVGNRLILPEYTHIRFILTAEDVKHSFAVPALAIKCNARNKQINITPRNLFKHYSCSTSPIKLNPN